MVTVTHSRSVDNVTEPSKVRSQGLKMRKKMAGSVRNGSYGTGSKWMAAVASPVEDRGAKPSLGRADFQRSIPYYDYYP
jgi:hypothetical protein